MEESVNKKLGELLVDMENGNVNALVDVYNLTGKILYTIANVYYKNKEDIEDLIQDFLETLLVKCKKFRENKNASAWLTISFKNQVLNRVKREKRIRVTDPLPEYEEFEALQFVSDIYIENHIFLKEIFSKLDETEQKIIYYRFWWDSSISEVAEIFRIPKSTMAARIKRIESKLRDYGKF